MQRRSLIVVSAAFLALVAACTKTESGTPAPDPSATVTAPAVASSAPPAPSASASATATAADAEAPAADAGRAADAPKSDAGGASTAAAAGSAGPAQCGTKPQPDCPLQGWMKANANPPVTANDTAALAVALDKIVAFAPPGYTNWASVAKDGAAAARTGDMTAAKASCRTCHDQYKAKYKTEMRARKI
jgi:hypothetical protein